MTQRTVTWPVPVGGPEPAGTAGEGAPLGESLGEPLAEAAVLGCLLQTTAAHARQVLSRLREQDWSVPQHAHVAQAIRALLDRGVPVDPGTVLGQLRRQGLENAHTAGRDTGVLLVELCQTAPTIASASHYTRIVLEHGYRRRVQTAALRLLRAAEHAGLDALTDLITAEHNGVTNEQQRLAAAAPATRPPTAIVTPRHPGRVPDPGTATVISTGRRRTPIESTRSQDVASALGSVRAEGGEPGPEVEALLAAWGRGELPTAVLTEARRLLAASGSIEHLLPAAQAS